MSLCVELQKPVMKWKKYSCVTRPYIHVWDAVYAAEDDDTIMDRIVANFMGFLDCLENPKVKGTLFCGGVWHVGEIKGNPKLNEAYKMDKNC